MLLIYQMVAQNSLRIHKEKQAFLKTFLNLRISFNAFNRSNCRFHCTKCTCTHLFLGYHIYISTKKRIEAREFFAVCRSFYTNNYYLIFWYIYFKNILRSFLIKIGPKMIDYEYHSTFRSQKTTFLLDTNFISVSILTSNSFLPKGHCTEVLFSSMLLISLLRKFFDTFVSI